MTQNNLGNVLGDQRYAPAGKAGVASCRGRDAYREALTVYTKSSFPARLQPDPEQSGVVLRDKAFARTRGEAGNQLLTDAVTPITALTV